MKYDFSANEYIYTRVNGTEYRLKDPFPSITSTYWGKNDPWNLEHKISWDEISPSLQELILVHRDDIEWENLGPLLQARILSDEQSIKDNTKSINDEIADRKSADRVIQTNLTALTNKVDNTLIPKLTELEGDISKLENTINGFNSTITNLQNEDNKLWTAVNQIWGSDLYRQNHETYNIYQLWQRIGSVEANINDIDLLKIWGDTATQNSHSTKNIKKIWEKISSLETAISGMAFDDTPIWGDSSTKSSASTKNIKKIWEKISDILDSLDSLINANNKIIDIRIFSEWSENYNGHTYYFNGVRIRLRDISNPNTYFLIWGINNAGRDSDRDWNWPVDGMYFKLPEAWPNRGLSIIASDKGAIGVNGARPLGCTFGEGSQSKTHIGLIVNNTYVDRTGYEPVENDNTISWSLIAIGY